MNRTGAELSPAQALELQACAPNAILIVDDEVSIARLFTIILSAALPGVAIDTANSGAAALELFDQKRHGVVLIDLGLPDMDGTELFRRLREQSSRCLCAMPNVVFCTGNAHTPEIRAILASEAQHGLLAKPVTRDALLQVVVPRLPRT